MPPSHRPMGLAVCPVDPEHGTLLQWGKGPEAKPFYCPHVDHDGRPARHPRGPLAGSSAFFTFTEVQK